MPSINILIADDHEMVCEGLKELLSKKPGYNVVSICGNGHEVLESLNTMPVELVLLDIEMPSLNGIDTLIHIKREHPAIRVLILSAHDEKDFILQSLKAGADGYVLKYSCFGEISHAIEAILDDNKYLSPRITDLFIDEFVEREAKKGESIIFTLLTSREREIIQLMGMERTTKEISSKIGVTVRTVDVHKNHIMEKLGINTSIGLVKFAIREGLVRLD
jgi:DNA-binding NarL/FixJ family response regulator